MHKKNLKFGEAMQLSLYAAVSVQLVDVQLVDGDLTLGSGVWFKGALGSRF